MTVIKAHNHLDLAILKLGIGQSFKLDIGLIKGDSDLIKQLDEISVAGFPNYHYGDSVYFSVGRVNSFRTFSGIQHILVQ